MIIPNKHLSQGQTPKLHVNLCHNHHQRRVTRLQRLKSTILLPKLFRKSNLVILEEANTTYALILILITQNYTDIDVRKKPIQPLSCAFFTLYFYFAIFFAHIIQTFLFSGAHTYTDTSTKTNRHATFNIIQFESRAIATRASSRRTQL